MHYAHPLPFNMSYSYSALFICLVLGAVLAHGGSEFNGDNGGKRDQWMATKVRDNRRQLDIKADKSHLSVSSKTKSPGQSNSININMLLGSYDFRLDTQYVLFITCCVCS
jgi:hypothetical protein